jgi:putative nucleotidyltransferase with HDIG domain
MTASLMFREQPEAATVRRTVLADLGWLESYPTLSDTALRVMTMAEREDISVAEVASVVRRDGVLAARLLRVANNCVYRGKVEVDDVQPAILRIGLQECTRLLSAMGLKGVYERCPAPVRERCEALLRHSLFVARLAAGLARLGAVCPPGPAFTAGLLHDIGRIVLCVKCDGTVADPPTVREDDSTPGTERDVYGIDHCAIGYQFATRNNLPENVVRVALNHHRPEEEHFQRTMVALVAVAENVANHVQWKHTVADFDLGECPRFAVLSLEWGPKREDAFRTGLAAATVQAIRDTRRMLKACA